MNKLTYSIHIDSDPNKVFDTMLGLSNKGTYEQWTHEFNPTSSYEGSWKKGSKILFVGIDDKGAKGGMVSRIVENIPMKFVSIQHYGLLSGETEITEGPEVEKWANSYENYTFEENQEGTYITIDLETTEEFEEYMNVAYPKALKKLKEICEI